MTRGYDKYGNYFKIRNDERNPLYGYSISPPICEKINDEDFFKGFEIKS